MAKLTWDCEADFLVKHQCLTSNNALQMAWAQTHTQKYPKTLWKATKKTFCVNLSPLMLDKKV